MPQAPVANIVANWLRLASIVPRYLNVARGLGEGQEGSCSTRG